MQIECHNKNKNGQLGSCDDLFEFISQGFAWSVWESSGSLQ